MADALEHGIAFEDFPTIGELVEACIVALGERGEIGLTQSPERQGG